MSLTVKTQDISTVYLQYLKPLSAQYAQSGIGMQVQTAMIIGSQNMLPKRYFFGRFQAAYLGKAQTGEL